MKAKLLIIFVLILAFTVGCSPEPEVNSVKVAVLPVIDALPLFVALEQGYFADEGLNVELIPVSSAPERDSLMQANQVDAILNEIVSTIFYNKTESNITTVRFLRVATEEYPLFRILAAKDSGIVTIDDLKGVEIGISEGTVIQYSTDRILQNAGLTKDEIVGVAVPKIPDRIALLASGELLAANLPDPAASAAIMQGAVVIIDDTTIPEISHSVLSFDAEMLSENPNTVKAFLRALELAVADINADKEQWFDLMIENGLLPPPLVGKYSIPDFPTASVPSEEQFEDAVNWALDLGFISESVDYSGSVSDDYLP